MWWCFGGECGGDYGGECGGVLVVTHNLQWAAEMLK
jgi:hypothetical protein